MTGPLSAVFQFGSSRNGFNTVNVALGTSLMATVMPKLVGKLFYLN